MKDLSFYRAVVCILLMLLVGCAGNAPSKYYILNPLPGENKVQSLSEESCISVGIGPIKLPEYLNRLQVIARNTQNEILLSNFDLWAEPLADSVPRTLGENISRILCTKQVVLFPWKPSRTPDYRVEVEVLSLDGIHGKAVSLEAWWTISYGPEQTARVTRKSKYNVPTADQSYEALIQAHSQALAALSHEIADAMRELGERTPKGK